MCGAFVLSEAEIVDFAALYDPQPFHLDAEAAKATYFAGLCASGLHTQAVAIGLMVRAIADVAVIAGYSLDQARFFVPVRAGVRYAVTAAWVATQVSPKNDRRGRASIRGTAATAEGVAVMEFGVTYTVARAACSGS